MTSEPTARILVVDDDLKTLEALEALLSGPGRAILKARSGTEALRLLLKQDVALILIDVRMPDMNGFETAALIRQNERLRYTPIIFLSAIDTLDEDVLRGVTSGAVDYLFKPVLPEILRAKVSVFVDLFHLNERLKQQAVRQTEERFRLLVESLQDYAIYLLDLEGRVTSWNSGAERIFGYAQEEILGRSFRCFYTPEDQARGHPEDVLARAAAEGHYEEEAWRRRRGGQLLWAHVSVTALKDELGNVIGFSKIVRDLTERKRVEEELKRLNEKLEKVVAERTAELVETIGQRERLQEQLLQSQKMESLGTLAGGVAHDFNNILNVIAGYASLLEREAADPAKVAEAAAIIKETVDRGTSLVRQLLAMARKGEAKLERVELNSLIEKLQALLQETFPRTIEVVLALAPEIPAVMADVNQVNQALLNLCLNARDAMPDGGKLVLETALVRGAELRQVFQEATAEDYVCIRVSDTGTGIDEGTRARIFEPFFTTKEQGKGTGLGLSVVYGIVSKHGGFIDVASQPGRGATFSVYLPVGLDGGRTEEGAGAPARGAEREGAAAGATILFVEDEIKQLRLMQRFLEGEGYKVVVARDGFEAVEVYTRHRDEIALVVLDLGLPKLNGWEAFQKMRELNPDLKALIATGYLSAQVEEEIAQSRVCGVIMKPYQLEEVLEKIAQAVESGSRLGDPAAKLASGEP